MASVWLKTYTHVSAIEFGSVQHYRARAYVIVCLQFGAFLCGCAGMFFKRVHDYVSNFIIFVPLKNAQPHTTLRARTYFSGRK